MAIACVYYKENSPLGSDQMIPGGGGFPSANFFFLSSPETNFCFLSGKGTSKIFSSHLIPFFCQFCEQTFYFLQFAEETVFSSLFAEPSFFKNPHSPSTYHLVGPLHVSECSMHITTNPYKDLLYTVLTKNTIFIPYIWYRPVV